MVGNHQTSIYKWLALGFQVVTVFLTLFGEKKRQKRRKKHGSNRWASDSCRTLGASDFMWYWRWWTENNTVQAPFGIVQKSQVPTFHAKKPWYELKRKGAPVVWIHQFRLCTCWSIKDWWKEKDIKSQSNRIVQRFQWGFMHILYHPKYQI